MSFDEIMQSITEGLTDDSEADIAYLQAQMEKYKNHEQGKEIIRACGRLIYKILPPEKKAKIDKAIGNDLTVWQSTLDEVRFNRFKQNNEKALELIEPLIKNQETMMSEGMFVEDTVSEYHQFKELFEVVLYCAISKTQKKIRNPGDLPFADLYFEYGSLLIDLNRIADAQAALKKALHWNPANCSILFEYAETFKMQNNLQEFFALTIKAFSYAFKPKHIAHCYRNLGYYFVEKELWQEAFSCLTMSLQFENDSKAAHSELYYIQTVTDGKVKAFDEEEFCAMSEKYGFPVGADKAVLGLAFSFGKQSIAEGRIDIARYALQIVYNLTSSDEVKAMLDAIPSES